MVVNRLFQLLRHRTELEQGQRKFLRVFQLILILLENSRVEQRLNCRPRAWLEAHGKQNNVEHPAQILQTHLRNTRSKPVYLPKNIPERFFRKRLDQTGPDDLLRNIRELQLDNLANNALLEYFEEKVLAFLEQAVVQFTFR